jgi:hypothetical protein
MIQIGCRRCVSICVDGPIGPHRRSCGCVCSPDGCAHAAGDYVQRYVSMQQRRLRERRPRRLESNGPRIIRRRPPPLGRRAQLLADARWWELEARRGYPSSNKSREHTSNLRWLTELLGNGVDITRPFHELVREHGGGR